MRKPSKHDPSTKFDTSGFLKDIGDVLRAKTIFFSPFFGAFISVSASKSDYIRFQDVLLIAMCFVTFGMGILYALTLTNLIHMLEGMRIFFNLNQQITSKILEEKPPLDRAGMLEELKNVHEKYHFENRQLKWTMWSIYVTSTSLLCHVYAGEWISRVAHRWTHHSH